MTEKYVLISLDDEKAKTISEILSNKTCKKILDFLAEKEASQKDISDKLKIPLNTVGHNIKKLLKSELIKKSKNFFWSQKGKKIEMYKVSNKSIVISPKSSNLSKLKSILPVVLVSGIATLMIKSKSFITQTNIQEDVFAGGLEMATKTVDSSSTFLSMQISPWIWFLSGAIIATTIFILWNWRKI